MKGDKTAHSGTKESDILSPKRRAEDIILGALGFGEDAQIIFIERTPSGFKGVGRWSDGEQFIFENEDPPSELEQWAMDQLITA